jgi:hypothetical protein
MVRVLFHFGDVWETSLDRIKLICWYWWGIVERLAKVQERVGGVYLLLSRKKIPAG